MLIKMTPKRLAILSILLALGVVFKSVFSIGDGEFRISFFDIPLFNFIYYTKKNKNAI